LCFVPGSLRDDFVISANPRVCWLSRSSSELERGFLIS